MTLRALGHFERALGMYDQAVNALEKTWGDEDPQTLTVVRNRASLLLQLGLVDEAREDIARAKAGFDEWESTHKASHPEAFRTTELTATLMSMSKSAPGPTLGMIRQALAQARDSMGASREDVERLSEEVSRLEALVEQTPSEP